MDVLAACSVSLATTVFGLFSLNKLAPVLGLLDHPSARKVHARATPLTGGLAIALGSGTLLIMAPEIIPSYFWILLGALMMVIIGSIDDANNIGVKKRLCMQAAAAAVAVAGGDLLITNLGTYPFIGAVNLSPIAATAITFFAILAGVNAFNLIDGLDGLAGSLALLPLLALCYLSASNGHVETAVLTGALSSCLAGFLLFNLRLPWQKQARAFLGDAGSTSLGFLISCLLIRHAQGTESLLKPMAALWLVAIPMIDTFTVIALRKLRGAPAFKASKDHLHHILVYGGLSVLQSWAVIVGSSSLFILAVLAGPSVPEWVYLVAFLNLLGLHVFLATCVMHRSDRFEPHRRLVKVRRKIERNLAGGGGAAQDVYSARES
jgi:UDP-GlcNAc:undecaprenyl-phosphate GlcNAc-1-phosphate transferase